MTQLETKVFMKMMSTIIKKDSIPAEERLEMLQEAINVALEDNDKK